jgi:hypothetical protein
MTMRWHVALAMGLMAWGTYVLTRHRPKIQTTEPIGKGPQNGRSQLDEALAGASPTLENTGPSVGSPLLAEEPIRSLIRVSWTVHVPEGTPDDCVYLCGNHAALGHWNPMGVALHRLPNGTYRGELRMRAGTRFEYKFTRGTWASVEVRKNGTHRPNRLLDMEHSAALECGVEAWADLV